MTPIVFLMGPTAAGKTDLAVRLVARLPADIVSVDSAMVYRGMDVGTGKPPPALLARAPHRLIDIREVTDPYSAGDFRRDAMREIEAIRARGRIPLLVGGTFLYFRALERGIAPLPRADPAVRTRLAGEGERRGWPALHARLAAVDPLSSRRIHPNDAQRIQRALEVFEVSGRPLSEWHGTEPASGALEGPVVRLALAPADRAELHRAIRTRFRAMVERGLVEEVRGLAGRPGVGPHLPSMRAVGYRQVWDHLDGRTDHAAMVERAVAATRQLARRQLTWLRSLSGVRWIDSTGNAEAKALDSVLCSPMKEPSTLRDSLQWTASRLSEKME
ncbi:MAG: tRNA (adenosine(37)-N6)-dimethylallyltransferase MiaA [Immundisolibacterales bacterium]|nr:tRNA (adenosine(37)-N6)-dimethylallyltransferase MiaA [Immundisolibacterales bacterium]